MSDAAAARWMRWSVAFVWLWTGLGVLHPYYREKGEFYLAPLGLPGWVMWATCAGEVGLAVWVALRKSDTWLTALQVATILGFTVILSFSHPELWLDPQGVLAKNLPIIGLLVAAWLLEREKKSVKVAYAFLGAVMIVFWLADCVLNFLGHEDPRYPFHAMVAIFELSLTSIVFVVSPGRFFGLVAIPGFLLIVSLMLLTCAISWEQPILWFHPFGPLSKNVVIVGASMMLVVLAPACQDWLRKQRGLSA